MTFDENSILGADEKRAPATEEEGEESAVVEQSGQRWMPLEAAIEGKGK